MVEAARQERLLLVDGVLPPPPRASPPIPPSSSLTPQTAGRNRVRPVGINPDLLRLADVLPLETPFRININPTSACNFRCRFCVMSREALLAKTSIGNRSISWGLYVKVINDLGEFPQALKRLNLSGLVGEPLLHPRLAEMVAYAKRLGVAEIVEFYTNGSLVTPENARALVSAGLDIITISVEHVSDAGYRDLTGSWGDYAAIRRSVATLRDERDRAGSKLRIDAKVIATLLTEEELATFGADFGDYADNLVTTEMHNWTGNDGVNLMLKEPTVGFNSVSPLKPERAVCPFPFYLLQVGAEGRVTVCTADWQMGACVGDASMDSLKSIWEGQPLRDLRVLMLRDGRQTHPTCGPCHNVISAVPAPNELDDDRDRLLPLFLHQSTG